MMDNSVISHLRNGGIVIIYDSDDREAEGDFAFCGHFVSPERVNFLLKNAGGLICLAMTEEWATKIGIKRQVSNGKDKLGTPFGYPINLITNKSGVSASERSNTILAASQDDSNEKSFYYPGHVHTLIANSGGLAIRDGHTEAIVELMKICELEYPGVLCEILSDNGEPASVAELKSTAGRLNIPFVSINEIKEWLGLKK